jgi:uncharacterized protein (TIRG00374 family)
LKNKHLGIVVAALLTLGTVGFVAYRYRDSGFSWIEFKRALEGVNWGWMGLSLVTVLTTYVGRAVRWEVLLRPLKPKPNLWKLNSATIIGFAAVVAFGRAGEPVRPYLIARNEGVSFASQAAAWIIERILDMLMVLIIFGIALTQVEHSSIRPGPKTRWVLETGGYSAGIAGLICLALLIALRLFHGHLKERLLGALPFLPEATRDRIGKVVDSFEQGMEAMRSTWHVVLLIFYSVVEWVLIALSFLFLFWAFPATRGLGVTETVMLMGLIAFGSLVQIPGVGGGMQVVTVLALTELFGIRIEAASGIALMLWLVTFVSIFPPGLILAFHEGIKWRTLRHLEVET